MIQIILICVALDVDADVERERASLHTRSSPVLSERVSIVRQLVSLTFLQIFVANKTGLFRIIVHLFAVCIIDSEES